LLNANELLQRAVQIVVAGDPTEPATSGLADAAWRAPQPNKVIQLVAPGAALPSGHPAAGKGPVGGKPAAYVCVGTTCSLPLTDARALEEHLCQ
jgi:uncharacterized protein YyaL (SSP411 family)